MTQRPNLTDVWAVDSSGANVPVDPDLDTTSPSYVHNVFIRGWINEKPQEAWLNFLGQGQDVKILDKIQGQQPFDTSVVYKKGSLVANVNGFDFGLATKDTSVETDFEEAILINSVVYADKVQYLIDTLAHHVSLEHVHQETADQVGVYIKSVVDDFFGSPTDIRTIVYHKSLTGAAHHETASQVGTVDATAGGTFTGDITFLTRVMFGGDDYVIGNGGLVNGSNSIAIVLQQATLVVSGTNYTILTKANFVALQNKINWLFALPSPLFTIAFYGAIGGMHTGNWTIDYASGSLAGSGYTLTGDTTFNPAVNLSNCTVHLVTNAGTAIRDYTSFAINKIQDVTTAMAPTASVVHEMSVYPQLTSFQKTMLYNRN